MATTAIGRMRDLCIMMQENLEPHEVVVLTITGNIIGAAELQILDLNTRTSTTVKSWATIGEMNRWAWGNIKAEMAEFL